MKKELETAIALDPKLADAYSLLAFAQAVSGEPEKGLATMKKAVELSPRNEMYQVNLANIYMANRKVDEAIALLHGLAGSGSPGVASHAAAALAQAESFKEQSKSFRPQIKSRAAENVEGGREPAGISEGRVEAEIHVVAAPPSTPVRFIKGKLAGVDCSAAPQALLSVVSGGRLLRMHIGDRQHLVLIGADQLSCDWKNKSVALNYRDRQDGGGDVVSLEVQ
jgi:tetratricopeptide (TPR) repeat protein